MHAQRFPGGEPDRQDHPHRKAGRRRRLRRAAAVAVGLTLLAGVAVAAAPGRATAAVRPGGKQAGTDSAPPASVSVAFRQLLDELRSAQDSSIQPAAYREYLTRQAQAAQDSVDAGRDCPASATLSGLRQDLTIYKHIVAGPIRVAPGVAVELSAAVLDMQTLVLALPGAAKCGGVASGSPSAQPETTVTSATTKQVTFRVRFPAPRFTAQAGGGQRYLEMSSPGMGDISAAFDGKQTRQELSTPGGGAIGRPGLPGTSESLAVPPGSNVSVRVLNTTHYSLPAVRLWPFQESAPAGQPGTGQPGTGQPGPGQPGTGPLPQPPSPFTVNEAAYQSKAAFPSAVAVAAAPGSEHGLRTASVSLAGGSYQPAERALTVLTSITVTVTFTGGAKTKSFGPASLISPWDEGFQSLWQSSLLNYAIVARSLTPARPVLRFCGEQMILITAPELRTAASQYAADRSADGVLTRVFLTGSTSSGGVGTTAAQIRDFVARQYDSACPIRPSYVLLLGDTALVPTFEISFGLHTVNGQEAPNWYEDPIATDMPYGFIHQAGQVDDSAGAGKTNVITDYGQDLFVGRIPVDSSGSNPEGAALAEIDSLHGYEDSPPAASTGFYGNVTGTEFFQPCPAIQTDCGRTASPPAPVSPSTQDTESFLRTSELAGQFAQVAGKTFNRVASDEANNDPGVTITPQDYDNGAGIPSGINWNGDAADITADVNAGTSVLWHSDHGYTDGSGWYEPGFGTGNVDSVSPPGTELPFVWSSDCDSGKFDSATDGSLTYTTHGSGPSFGEAWLETGHAAAFVGASRESPIYQDGYLLDGMGDNLFPEEGNVFRALFGIAPVAPVTTLGPLLDAAKVYMEQQTTADMATDIGPQGTVLEYNALGDPSMPVWRNAPRLYIPKSLGAVLGSAGRVTVRDRQQGTNGTVVILRINGTVLGGGVLRGGVLNIPVSASLTSLNGVTATLVGPGYLMAAVPLGPAAIPAPGA